MLIRRYGLGGYCDPCDTSHDHPLHNLVEQVEVDDVPETAPPTLEPISLLPVGGETIDEVKASADAAIADLAVQVEARLAQITEPQL